MEEEKIRKIYELLDNIKITASNEEILNEIREDLENEDYQGALEKIQQLENKEELQDFNVRVHSKEQEEPKSMYPEELRNDNLERTYMGLLLSDPRYIVKYYFLYEDCYFENKELLNIYKSVLFTEGGNYTPESAKRGYNFSVDSEEVYNLKNQLKKEVADQNYHMEKI